MPDNCELCGSQALDSVYAPERSERGINIHICAHCGLVQSLPRVDRAKRRPPAVSGGADWGNVRYGKGFRTQIAVDAVLRHTPPENSFTVLDVGSNRGRFAEALLECGTSARNRRRRTGRARGAILRRLGSHGTSRRAHRRCSTRNRALRRRPFLPHDRTSGAPGACFEGSLAHAEESAAGLFWMHRISRSSARTTSSRNGSSTNISTISPNAH